MSTIKSKNVQIGDSGTATDNFTIYQPTAPDGTLRIGNGNTGTTSAQVVLTSAGNVGIGTSSPRVKFDVVSAGASPSWSASANTAAIFENNVASAGRSYVSIVGRSAGQSELWFADEALENVGRVRYDHTVDAMSFWTNGNERARIGSSGNLLVGTTSDGQTVDGIKLLANGRIFATSGADSIFYRKTTDLPIIQFRSDNVSTNRLVASVNATGTFVTASDRLLKKNIVKINGELQNVMSLVPVRFNWISDADEDLKEYGFIAQDVEQVYPKIVFENEGKKMLNIAGLVPMLTTALQEAVAEINDLKARLDAANL